MKCGNCGNVTRTASVNPYIATRAACSCSSGEHNNQQSPVTVLKGPSRLFSILERQIHWFLWPPIGLSSSALSSRRTLGSASKPCAALRKRCTTQSAYRRMGDVKCVYWSIASVAVSVRSNDKQWQAVEVSHWTCITCSNMFKRHASHTVILLLSILWYSLAERLNQSASSLSFALVQCRNTTLLPYSVWS